MRRFWSQRVAAPVKALLRQGLTPEGIALSLAFGVAAGLFPVIGATTFLGLALGSGPAPQPAGAPARQLAGLPAPARDDHPPGAPRRVAGRRPARVLLGGPDRGQHVLRPPRDPRALRNDRPARHPRVDGGGAARGPRALPGRCCPSCARCSRACAPRRRHELARPRPREEPPPRPGDPSRDPRADPAAGAHGEGRGRRRPAGPPDGLGPPAPREPHRHRDPGRQRAALRGAGRLLRARARDGTSSTPAATGPRASTTSTRPRSPCSGSPASGRGSRTASGSSSSAAAGARSRCGWPSGTPRARSPRSPTRRARRPSSTPGPRAAASPTSPWSPPT